MPRGRTDRKRRKLRRDDPEAQEVEFLDSDSRPNIEQRAEKPLPAKVLNVETIIKPSPEEEVATVKNSNLVYDEIYKPHKDLKLAELFKGKRIALIGTSSHLLEEECGNLIDSYDLVCRVNITKEIPSELVKHCGSRTDILFSNGNVPTFRKIEAENEFWKKTLKYFICSNWQSDNGKSGLKIISKYQIPYHFISKDLIKAFMKEHKTLGNTGLYALIALLNYEIKELYITGFSFYNMGKNRDNQYYDKTINNSPNFGVHDQEPQITYFQKLLNKYYKNPITVDTFIKQNFTLPEIK
jgi:hypothetical protein